MKTNPEQLPPELVWQADGHATEEVIVAVADEQQAIVPAAAFAHTMNCNRCAQLVGEAALRSLQASEDLRLVLLPAASVVAEVAMNPEAEALVRQGEMTKPSAARASGAIPWRPLPRKALAAALAVAALSAAPSALDLAARWPELAEMARRSVPIVLRCVVMVARSADGAPGPTAALLSWAAAVLLMLMGLLIARSMSRSAVLEGGM